jgi:hypothetical protein
MTVMLKKAWTAVQSLPKRRQDEVGEMLLDYVNSVASDLRLTAAQRKRIRASIARQDFLSEAETRAMYQKYRT